MMIRLFLFAVDFLKMFLRKHEPERYRNIQYRMIYNRYEITTKLTLKYPIFYLS